MHFTAAQGASGCGNRLALFRDGVIRFYFERRALRFREWKSVRACMSSLRPLMHRSRRVAPRRRKIHARDRFRKLRCSSSPRAPLRACVFSNRAFIFARPTRIRRRYRDRWYPSDIDNKHLLGIGRSVPQQLVLSYYVIVIMWSILLSYRTPS